MALPPLLPFPAIHRRLQAIFPEGTPRRSKCTPEIAAKTIFAMLYIGAMEDRDVWIRPDQVTRMTDAQAARQDEAARLAWLQESMKSSKGDIPGRWFAGNTRESIRDDTLREGLVPNGGVIERAGVPTTSPRPRYGLRTTFAELFDPALQGTALEAAITSWQEQNLSAGARARITMWRQGALAATGKEVMVKFPSGETRRMVPGLSSVIAKAVIEEFAPRFLGAPGVIFLSESANKVVARDDNLAKAISLDIQSDRHLPDIVLADTAPAHGLLVFVEVVATDGPVSERRKDALLRLAADAGFPAEHVAFVTAYLDRSESAFKKTVDTLAWGSFAWFTTEPDNLVRLYHGEPQNVKKLSTWQM